MTCSGIFVGRFIGVGHVVCNRIQLKRFVLFGNALISVLHVGLFLLFVVISNRSTRPPSGNQVDGLPPALSRWTENARDLFRSCVPAVFVVCQGLFELHFGPGLVSRPLFWSELDRTT